MSLNFSEAFEFHPLLFSTMQDVLLLFNDSNYTSCSTFHVVVHCAPVCVGVFSLRLIHMCYMEIALIYLQQWQNTTTDLAESPLPTEPAESDEVVMMMMMMMQELMSLLLVFKFQSDLNVRNVLYYYEYCNYLCLLSLVLRLDSCDTESLTSFLGLSESCCKGETHKHVTDFVVMTLCSLLYLGL